MSQVPNDTRFIGINPTVSLRERRSARINRETQPYTMQDISDNVRPYKVYTALLTQRGGGDEDKRNADDPILTIGTTYWITEIDGNPDFTNVGAPDNDLGTYFVATGENPNWGTGGAELKFIVGTPVVKVLENTIGNVYFRYNDEGLYTCNSPSLFTENKTTIDMDAFGQNGDPMCHLIYKDLDTSVFTIGVFKDGFANDRLSNNRLEIRVYN